MLCLGLLTILAVIIYTANADPVSASIVLDTDGSTLIAQDGIVSGAVAWATYEELIETIGANKLWVHTSSDGTHADTVLARAAGMVEGYLAYDRMTMHFKNFKKDAMADYAGEWPQELLDYSNAQLAWMDHQVAKATTDPWWQQVGLQLTQLRGMHEGYVLRVPETTLTVMDFYLMNMAGDWDDLGLALFPEGVARQNLEKYWDSHHHCTGAVHVTPANRDIYFAQDTWSSYYTMTRIMKSYELNYAVSSAKHIVFSSYPIATFSIDDMYITDQKLAVMETTFHCWNVFLYDLYVRPETVPTWVRTQLANRMAHDGDSWIRNFVREQSGTYNNQYFILDYKLFTPLMETLQPKTVMAVEMMPGHYRKYDATHELVTNSYLISQNTPNDPYMYAMAGYTWKDVDPYWGYWTQRYNLFVAYMADIYTYDDFRAFMQYNNYLEDPIVKGDPGKSICARYDLRPRDDEDHPGSPFGCLDAKTMNYVTAMNMTFDIAAYPTMSGGLPPWSFSDYYEESEYPEGLPVTWDKFDWFSFYGNEA